LDEKDFKPKWNDPKDGEVNRQSHEGKYEVKLPSKCTFSTVLFP